MEEEEKKEKRPLDLNWETLLPSQDDEPPPVLVVEQESPTIEEPQQQQQTQRDDVEYKTDHELNELITRQSSNLESLAPKLPDKGAKLRANLQRLMDERERRKLCRVEKDADICEKPTQSHSSSFCGNITEGLSVKECMKILKRLLTYEDPLYYVAINAFCKKKEYREVWMEMESDEERMGWIQSLRK